MQDQHLWLSQDFDLVCQDKIHKNLCDLSAAFTMRYAPELLQQWIVSRLHQAVHLPRHRTRARHNFAPIEPNHASVSSTPKAAVIIIFPNASTSLGPASIIVLRIVPLRTT